MFTNFNASYDPAVWMQRVGWAKYLCGQWEICPTSGRRHFQGYVYGDTPLDLAAVSRKFEGDKPHLEQRKGSHQQAVNYCTKEESRAPDSDPVELGQPPKQGARSDLDAVKRTLDEQGLAEAAQQHFGTFIRYHRGLEKYLLLSAKPRDPSIEPENYYFWGAPGTGKSRAAYDLAAERGIQCCTLSLSGSSPWFDNYQPGVHGMILLDDYKSVWAATFFLRLTDRYPMMVPTKGGHVQLGNVIIVVTSNYPLEQQYPTYAEHLENGQDAFRRRFKQIRQFKTLKEKKRPREEENEEVPPEKRQKQ